MRKTIIELLEVTPSYYNKVVLHTFVDWCMGFNPEEVSLQRALLDKRLLIYFKREYSVLEHLFMIDMQGCSSLNKVDKNEYYAIVTQRIFNNYPGALKQRVKKKENIRNFN